YVRKTPGSSVPVLCGSATHRFYVLIGAPTAPWTTETPWVAALELACGWAAGAWTKDEAAARITEQYNGCGRVAYDTKQGSTFYGDQTYLLSQMIDRLTGGDGLGEFVNFTDNANTLFTFAHLIRCESWHLQMV